MEYIFSPPTQIKLALGVLKQTATRGGQLLPHVIDPSTGRIVEIAKAVAGFSLKSFIAPAQLVIAPIQMLQTHLGFQKTYQLIEVLQNSVEVLQATTAVIGVGVAATGALTAVNLYQTLKLREDVKQLKVQVKDGFINLEHLLRGENAAIIQEIKELEFKQHRLELIKAYGYFIEATKLIKLALAVGDLSIRNADLSNARQTLGNALSIYRNPQLLSETCVAGQLRRLECAWTIEQTIALTLQIQNEPTAVKECISHLRGDVHQNLLSLAENCESEVELDFIFPEITRIYNQDLTVLDDWAQQIDWIQSLSAQEQKRLTGSTIVDTEEAEGSKGEATVLVVKPEEFTVYEQLKSKSHFLALRDQLKFFLRPSVRQFYELYIQEQAERSKQLALVPPSWRDISDMTISNIYWYFKARDNASTGNKLMV